MKPAKDVMIEDMGIKLTGNGIDNARLMFSNVRVPRTALLDKLNQVTKEGKFVSEDSSVSARFFKVADRLLSGRLCIASMSMSAIKIAIYNTVKYSQ